MAKRKAGEEEGFTTRRRALLLGSITGKSMEERKSIWLEHQNRQNSLLNSLSEFQRQCPIQLAEPKVNVDAPPEVVCCRCSRNSGCLTKKCKCRPSECSSKCKCDLSKCHNRTGCSCGGDCQTKLCICQKANSKCGLACACLKRGTCVNR